ncbi:MAG: GNAT family N-acyltransferase [Rhodovibrionaceae bacterium]
MVLVQDKEARPVEVCGRNLLIRLAESEEEIEASQRLRYRIFVEEMAAKATDARRGSGRESDSYDPFCEHLLVFDLDRCTGPQGDAAGVVGTYRFMRRAQAQAAGGFYTAGEYEIARLEAVEGEILEVGRSCIDKDYRDGATIQLLWKGISAYVFHYDVTFLFGCASLPSVKPDDLALPLSYLYHNHLAPEDLRVRARPELYVDMNRLAPEDIERKAALKTLPPLLKGYLRLGGFVGDGAVVDEDFGTTDVCLILKTDWASDRYRKHYTRDDAAKTGDGDG